MVVCAAAIIEMRANPCYDSGTVRTVEAVAPSATQELAHDWPQHVPTLYDLFRSLPRGVEPNDYVHGIRIYRTDEDEREVDW